MNEIKKLRRTAKVLCTIVTVYSLLFVLIYLGQTAIAVLHGAIRETSTLAATVCFFLYLCALLTLSAGLLRSVWAAETPFSPGIARKIKILGVLLAVYEPLFTLTQYCSPLVVDNISYRSVIGLGGSITAAGLVVFCVGTIFQYGVVLQTQADETL